MKSSWKGYLENTLFVLTTLLVFLLVFEDYIELPFWFQPIGRLHPIVLHFPITLLFIAFLSELLPKKWFEPNHEFYYSIKNSLLLIAAILAGFTAIFGLFLSLEEGYDANSLFWHKYLGAGIVIVAAALYWLKKQHLRKPIIPKFLALISLVVLTLGAHKGADITHGEGFLLGDLGKKAKEPVLFQDALVFEDLVMPILEDKCIMCHNNRKSKGKLIMTSLAGILEGGKSGLILTNGHPETSTLSKRLLLPLEDEKHMPPSGKPQLNSDEIAILNFWIKHGVENKIKLASLPASDSLRILGRKRIEINDIEVSYDFEAASAKTIEDLTNPYRVVLPLAKRSPALQVSFFGSKEFSSEKLEDILQIKEQVVSLQLHKIPVKDSDLALIGKLPNLELLNLNFSKVTGKGLMAMTEIPKLQKLSIAGVELDKDELEYLLKTQKSLKSVHVWNTNLNENEIKELDTKYSSVSIIGGRAGLSDMLIQLNQPFLGNKSAIFQDSIELELHHPIKDVEMRITMNNEALNSSNGLLYEPNKVVIKESKTFKAKAFKEGWLPSEEVILNVYQNKFDPDSVTLLTKLNRVHPANGSKTFFDKVLGKNGANNPAWANNWAGFKTNDMVLMLEYDESVPVSNISLNMLIEPETKIFPPESIEIWGGNSPNQLKLLTRVKPKQPTKNRKAYIELIECPITTFEGKYFKVIAKPLQQVPKWSSNKREKALFLVDELFVN